MIALLRGSPLHRAPDRCIIDVRGVGYEVFATNRGMDAWFQSAGEQVEVHVATYVREDAISLYGFDDPAERTVFQTLMSVSGIGPKVALATLETFDPASLAQAVETDDLVSLSKISGVGKKTAQRMALELKGKISAPSRIPAGAGKAPAASPKADTLGLALERLGYNKSEIDRAKQALADEGIDDDVPVSERLREALKLLYGNR